MNAFKSLVAVALTGTAFASIGPASIAEDRPTALPAPPANGVMGFVLSEITPPVLQEKAACPMGTVLKVRDQYLAGLPEAERTRLLLKENEKEMTQAWQRSIFGPGGTNICSQPDMFPSRPDMRTVQSKTSYGIDLDDGGNDGDTCAHEEFTAPTGARGIDNQEYRVMGCTLEWRGTDGIQGDVASGMKQFIASGEWTQVLLLRGVDSLQNDPEVDVIFANTPDKPPTDSMGNFLRGASFTVSTKPPRERNVLKGRIVNGVLITLPQDVKLAQTWGQGGARDIRGNRTKYDYRKAKLQLAFQPDGSLKGMFGGYRPVADVMQSAMLGGAGSSLVAGLDCAQYIQTLKKYADGVKDPRTGKCTAVSAALRVTAVPAFVNDDPSVSGSANRTARR